MAPLTVPPEETCSKPTAEMIVPASMPPDETYSWPPFRIVVPVAVAPLRTLSVSPALRTSPELVSPPERMMSLIYRPPESEGRESAQRNGWRIAPPPPAQP